MTAAPDLPRRFVAELIGTALLLAIVVGSGIMGDDLAKGNTAIALLANSLATGAGLFVLILVFGPISGAHFNPVVTLSDAMRRGISWAHVPLYVIAQVTGAFAGVAAAHAMFDKAIFSAAQQNRSGFSHALAEGIATFGLLAVIFSTSRFRSKMTPMAVAAWITSAYWFTSSTSFANPAVTIARTATSTFTGIRFEDAPTFVVAQIVGATCAVFLFRWMIRR